MLINRFFASGDLFVRVRNKPLPDWAAEFDCKSWAQFSPEMGSRERRRLQLVGKSY